MKSINSGEIKKKKKKKKNSMTMNKSKDIVNEKKLGPQKKFLLPKLNWENALVNLPSSLAPVRDPI